MPKKNRKDEDIEVNNGTGKDVTMTEMSPQKVECKSKKRPQSSESHDRDTDDFRGSSDDSDPESQEDPKKLKKEKRSKKAKKEKKVQKEKRLKKEHSTSVNDEGSLDEATKMSLTPPPISSLSAYPIQLPTPSSTTSASGATTPLVAAVGSLNVSSSTVPTHPHTKIKTSIILPRTALVPRMVPRQISRPAPGSRTSWPGSLPSLPLSHQRDIPKIFRAKDIIAHHDQSRKEATTTSSSSTSSTLTSTTIPRLTFKSKSVSTASQEMTPEMLKSAEPIVVFPAAAQRGKHGEYLFGNYPHYYIKRSSEQKRGRRDRTKDQGEEGGEKEMGGNHGDNTAVTTMTRRRIYQQEKISVTSATTPSVLLPCTDYEHTHGHATITSVQDLARHVDLRLEFLKPSWFYKKRVLDIGCNAALLTVFIALHYQPRKIQGVDIDPSLIAKAQKFVLNTFSQLSPQAYTQRKTEATLSSPLSSSTSSSGRNSGPTPYEAYFPKSMSYLHGLLPVPPKTVDTEFLFPHNIEFRIADWMASEPEHSEKQDSEEPMWDVIIGFSLTKWIHLHYGDKGLQEFFHKVYKSLAPGGLFLLEPQAFITYNKRSKITLAMRENYLAIKMKPEMFEEYLLQTVGFKESKLLGHSEGAAKNFNRDIFMFRK
ncbi:hypothetical protein BGZ92_010853 [Podila epicladia]|nr:hypothetical protein BGZ92_010853 [Podila epicladia]